ncbi:MAG: FkbM family methyltransferase [Clostridia bacterium]|nr:FkbM family methyltransferase [Clostridia bacterium]
MPEFKHPDLFGRLAAEQKSTVPRAVLLYGMGNGADKILAELSAKSIPVAGFFASDGFVRGQFFHGQRVLSFSEVRERYAPEDCVILLAFGSARPEVLETVQRVAAEYEVLVPDMPVCGGPLFDAAFYDIHRDEIAAARALFADEASKELFDKIIAFRLTGDFRTLMDAVSERSAWDILKESRITVRKIADFGAYTGDSARAAMALFPINLILAAEPDRRNFRKLSDWSGTVTDCTVECHRVAVCDTMGEALFDDSGNRNAGLCTGKSHVTVCTDTPDGLLAGRAVDYIKYDIEGAEASALNGSVKTIRTFTPALRIALYHRSADLFQIPLQLSEISNRYRLYLTRERSFPAWDIDLVAIPIERHTS